MATWNQIVELYVALFHRAPTKKEVDEWYKVEADKPMGEAAADMMFAAMNLASQDPTVAALYPTYVLLAKEGGGEDAYRKVIEDVYKVVLNKDYTTDPEGIDGWLKQVEKRGGDLHGLGETIGDIIYIADQYATGELPTSDPNTLKAAKAFRNKTDVAITAAQQIPEFNGDFETFQKLITDVNDDPSSVEKAKEEIEKLREEESGTETEETPSTNQGTDQNQENQQLTKEEISKMIGELPDFDTHIKPLLSGYKFNEDVITYGFPTEMPNDPDYQEINQKYIWKPMDPADKEMSEKIIQNLDPYLRVDFKEVEGGGMINFNGIDHYEDGYVGFGYSPTNPTGAGVSGDVFVILPSNVKTISHELGHSLGLKHPFEGEVTMPPEDDTTTKTVMSYTSTQEYLVVLESSGSDYTCNLVPVNGGFKLYDIEALQYLYGGNPNHNTENNTYDLSQLPLDGSFYVIDDRGGSDLLDLSKTDWNNQINLAPNTFSSIGSNFLQWTIHQQALSLQQQYNWSDSFREGVEEWVWSNVKDDPLVYRGEDNLGITAGSIIENYLGGSGEDIVYDNSANNSISTGAGDDIIYLLNGGDDQVDGGDGFDRVYIRDLESYTQQWVDQNKLLLDNGENQIFLTNVEEVDPYTGS